MTRIQAAEDSFSRANNFYILMWVVTSIVLATAYLEFRSSNREISANKELIGFYTDIERDAGQIAQQIRSAVYLTPDYKDERSGIDTIRRLRSAAIAQHNWLNENLLAKTPNLSLDERIAINKPRNYMEQMLLLNDAVNPVASKIEAEPSLLLAEHQPGSYLVTDSIEHLRFEDATRYLWLSTLNLHEWSAVLRKHISALESGAVLKSFANDLARAVKPVQSAGSKQKRQLAAHAWLKWIRSSSPNDQAATINQHEARRRASLTLAQTSVFLREALQKRNELDLQTGGQGTTVKIPVLSVPLQLRDAALATPWVLVFCALAIMIYTQRGLHYSPAEPDATTVVGKLPSFYALYGFHKYAGIAAAFLLLLLPTILVAVLLPTYMPSILTGWQAQTVFYYAGIALAVICLSVTLRQVPNVLNLINGGIAIRADPED